MTGIDWLILALYFAFVLGIGVTLKSSMKTSTDFFLAGRAIPAWVCGLAFMSANLGAQEVIGMGASGAKYGIATSHFYWIGAIPAMVFVGIFMMPFYYGSRARSVPEYLRLRFDEKTRALNAISFAIMTVFSSGISMYAMARLLQSLHVLDFALDRFHLPADRVFDLSVILSAVIVLAYVLLGGLISAIYNEVLQFFLIVAGFAPLVFLGLKNIGGWRGLVERLPRGYTHAWHGLGHPPTNPLGVEWFGLVMGLGFVLSFGYWCTDFLVVQRAMAADSMEAARRTPLIASIPKMLFPFLVILPGLIAIALPDQPARQQFSSAGTASFPRRSTRRPVGRSWTQTASRCWITISRCPTCCCTIFPPGSWGWDWWRCSRASCPGWRATSPPSTRSGPTTSTSHTSAPTPATRTICGWVGWPPFSAWRSRSSPPISRCTSTTSWTYSSSFSPSSTRPCSQPSCSACSGNAPPATALSPGFCSGPRQQRFIRGSRCPPARRRVSKVDGLARWSTTIRVRWPRISGRRSSPGRCAFLERSWSA